jgi:hypothetical protein
MRGAIARPNCDAQEIRPRGIERRTNFLYGHAFADEHHDRDVRFLTV